MYTNRATTFEHILGGVNIHMPWRQILTYPYLLLHYLLAKLWNEARFSPKDMDKKIMRAGEMAKELQ